MNNNIEKYYKQLETSKPLQNKRVEYGANLTQEEPNYFLENSSQTETNKDIPSIEYTIFENDLNTRNNPKVEMGENYFISQGEIQIEPEIDYEDFIIQQYREELELAKMAFEKQDESDGFISDLFNGFKELTGLGISKSEVKAAIEKQEKALARLQEAADTGNFAKVYQQITGTYYNEEALSRCCEVEAELDFLRSNMGKILSTDEPEEIKQEKLNNYLKNYEMINGVKYEDLVNDYQILSDKYLSSSNELTNILNSYLDSQEGFIDKIASVTQVGGMGLMIVGGIACFIPGGQMIGAGMLKAGQMMAIAGTFGDNATELIDTATNNQSLEQDKEQYGKILQETAVEGTLFAAGYAAGSVAGKTGGYVLDKTGSKFLSKAADIATDTTLSLAGDAAITGEVDLSGEGASQLLGVLTGSATSKINIAKVNADYTRIKPNDTQLPDALTKSFRVSELSRLGVRPQESFGIENLNNSQYAQAMKLAKSNVSSIKIAELMNNPQAIKKYDGYIAEGFKAHEAVSLALCELDEVQIQKVIDITKKGVSVNTATDIVKNNFNEEQTAKAIEIAKLDGWGISATKIAKLDDCKFNKAKELISLGAWAMDAEKYANLDDLEYARVKNLAENGIDGYHLNEVLSKEDLLLQTEDFIKKGIEGKHALELAKLTPQMRNKVFATAKELEITPEIAFDITKAKSEIIKNNKHINKNALDEYVNNINYNSILQLAPNTKNFNAEQWKSFINYHFENGTTEFNKNTLTFDKDLTKHLENNYVNAEKLDALLSAYPLTPRNVGSLPDGWIKNPTDKNVQEIYSAIESFKTSRNVEEFSQEMSRILQKEVCVENVGSGAYGTGYKITTDGAEATCLKLFHDKTLENDVVVHGPRIETQIGLFANKHSDKFTKMFFGKVAGQSNNDGFLVTKFISEGDKTQRNYLTYLSTYSMKNFDSHSENVINNISIDYGGVKVKHFGIKMKCD